MLVDTIYPKTCAGCGMRGVWLCARCHRTVPPLNRDRCDRCGFPSAGECRQCRHLDARIGRARSAYPYTGWVRTALHSFKYGSEFGRAEHLAALMCLAIDDLDPFDVVIPVPLHAHRYEDRGYNQAELLSKHIADHYGAPLRTVLQRTRNTRAQVDLHRDDRLINVTEAFTLDPAWWPPRNRRVLLVDDVRTTGATLNACACALTSIDPASVQVATFALDVPRRELDAWLARQGR